MTIQGMFTTDHGQPEARCPICSGSTEEAARHRGGRALLFGLLGRVRRERSRHGVISPRKPEGRTPPGPTLEICKVCHERSQSDGRWPP